MGCRLMRALRSSLYVGAYEPPMTTVVLESDVIDTLESIRHRHLQPGALVIHDIFETDHEDIVGATTEAVARAQANGEQEAHQALLFYWSVMSWQRLREGGTLFMDKPAPLSREEIEVVFAQLAQHPEYRNFHIVSHTREGEPVELVNGNVKEA